MLPDEKIMCHHTGFEKRCFDMVTQAKCRKWRNLLGVDPQTGAQMNVWDCVDGLQHQIQMDTGKAVMHVVAGIDKLANTVSAANDSGMANALLGLNAQIKRVADANAAQVDAFIADDVSALKLLGSA